MSDERFCFLQRLWNFAKLCHWWQLLHWAALANAQMSGRGISTFTTNSNVRPRKCCRCTLKYNWVFVARHFNGGSQSCCWSGNLKWLKFSVINLWYCSLCGGSSCYWERRVGSSSQDDVTQIFCEINPKHDEHNWSWPGKMSSVIDHLRENWTEHTERIV